MQALRGTYVMGSLGAVLGLVLALTILVISYHFGSFGILFIFLLVLFPGKTYDLLGGKQAYGKLAILVMVSLLGLGLAILLEDIIAAKIVFETTYLEASHKIFKLIKLDPTYRMTIISDHLSTWILYGLSLFAYLYWQVKAWRGRNWKKEIKLADI